MFFLNYFLPGDDEIEEDTYGFADGAIKRGIKAELRSL